MPCPELLTCGAQVDGEKFETICISTNRFQSLCWRYREKHTVVRTPKNWIKTTMTLADLDVIFKEDFTASDFYKEWLRKRRKD